MAVEPKQTELESVPYEVEDVKDWLEAISQTFREIENENERLSRLEAKMYTAGAMNYSDSPKGSGTNDALAFQTARRQEILDRVGNTIEQQKQMLEKLESVLAGVKKADERAVIRMRYVDREKWPNVAYIMFGKKDDYSDKGESYLHRVMMLHGHALQNMAAYITKEGIAL